MDDTLFKADSPLNFCNKHSYNITTVRYTSKPLMPYQTTSVHTICIWLYFSPNIAHISLMYHTNFIVVQFPINLN